MGTKIRILIDDSDFVPECQKAVWKAWVSQSQISEENVTYASELKLSIPSGWKVPRPVSARLLARWWLISQGLDRQTDCIYFRATGWPKESLQSDFLSGLKARTQASRFGGNDWNGEPLMILPSSLFAESESLVHFLKTAKQRTFTSFYEASEQTLEHWLGTQSISLNTDSIAYEYAVQLQNRPWYSAAAQGQAVWLEWLQKALAQKLYSAEQLKKEILNGLVRPSLLIQTENTEPKSINFKFNTVDDGFVPPEICTTRNEKRFLRSRRIRFRNVFLRFENMMRTKGRQKTLTALFFRFWEAVFKKIVQAVKQCAQWLRNFGPRQK